MFVIWSFYTTCDRANISCFPVPQSMPCCHFSNSSLLIHIYMYSLVKNREILFCSLKYIFLNINTKVEHALIRFFKPPMLYPTGSGENIRPSVIPCRQSQLF